MLVKKLHKEQKERKIKADSIIKIKRDKSLLQNEEFIKEQQVLS